MADRRVQPAPYGAVCDLIDWVTDGLEWALFDGWCASSGIQPLTLPAARFLNLVHHYALQQIAINPENPGETVKMRTELNNKLTGRRHGTMSRVRVDDRGIPMPDWWSDENSNGASAAGIAMTMRAWRGSR